MNWKLSLLGIALLTSRVQADIMLEINLSENANNKIAKTIALAAEDTIKTIEHDNIKLVISLKEEQTEGALVAISATSNEATILETELSMVWGREEVAQTETTSGFVKVACIANQLPATPATTEIIATQDEPAVEPAAETVA